MPDESVDELKAMVAELEAKVVMLESDKSVLEHQAKMLVESNELMSQVVKRMRISIGPLEDAGE